MSGKQPQEIGLSALRQWKIGDVTVTKLVECQHAFDITVMFPNATTEEGTCASLAAAAFSDARWALHHKLSRPGGGCAGKRIIVDTCNGNDKHRPLALDLFSNLKTSFLRDLEAAGFRRDSFDTVLCTHLHSDHIGWNTMLVDGEWVPTFRKRATC